MERKTKEEEAKNKVVNILLVMAMVSILVLFIFTTQVFKIKQDHIFKTKYITDYDNGGLSDSLILDDNNTVQLQAFIIPITNSLDYTFCVRNRKNSSSSLKLSLVNKDLEILGSDYFINTSTYDCIYTNETLKRKEYLGVLCHNCNSTNRFIIQEELLGVDVKKITLEGEEVNVEVANTNGYVLRQHMNGKYLLKLLDNIYNTLLFLLVLGILIMVGYEEFKEILAGVENA